jgi:SAM-dependent methyltransferase
MTAWVDFYRGRCNNRYYEYFVKKYAPFLDAMFEISRPSDDFLEVGCGTANTTRALIERLTEADYWYAATDTDPAMLALADEARGDRAISFSLADARDVPEYPPDVVHSHGLLEHFDDASIRQIVTAAALAGARASVHYVPSSKYEKPSFGDERLMTAAEWYLIGEPSSIIEFNDGYDLALIWKHR